MLSKRSFAELFAGIFDCRDECREGSAIVARRGAGLLLLTDAVDFFLDG